MIFNLPNRVPGPPDAGYSVRVTYARDFRGGRLTYDSHDGTDFAVCPGTEVVAAAAGNIVAVRNDMQRGGLKVVIDHGSGVLTVACHLSRALLQPGDSVDRGQVVALSGMSSVDGLLFSPWLAPHVHYTVMLNGTAADPWATDDEVSIWRQHNDPVPDDGRDDTPFEPTVWHHDAADETIASCRDPKMRRQLVAIADPDARALAVAFERRLSHHRFAEPTLSLTKIYPRQPLLDLPFAVDDCVGTIFAD